MNKKKTKTKIISNYISFSYLFTLIFSNKNEKFNKNMKLTINKYSALFYLEIKLRNIENCAQDR